MTGNSRYFDWAATAIPDHDILAESLAIGEEFYENPSSIHSGGKAARGKLEEARERAAFAIGVPPETIHFTGGGTEADQLPILSCLRKPVPGTVAISVLEHPAIHSLADSLKAVGWKVTRIPCDSRGIVTPECLRSGLGSDTAMVCVMAVNNETGARQPIPELAAVLDEVYAGKRRPKLHVDCVQAAGKIPFTLAHSGIDSATMAAHKICGPRGVGLLYLKNPLEPFLKGGGQERGYRGGTENLAGAWALSRCLEKYYVRADLPDTEAYRRYRAASFTTDLFVKSLAALRGCAVIPGSRDAEHFSPYIVLASFAGVPGEVMLRALDEQGFAVSTGSACANNHQHASHSEENSILKSMGVSAESAQNTVRFSFGHSTRAEDLAALVNAVKNVCTNLARP